MPTDGKIQAPDEMSLSLWSDQDDLLSIYHCTNHEIARTRPTVLWRDNTFLLCASSRIAHPNMSAHTCHIRENCTVYENLCVVMSILNTKRIKGKVLTVLLEFLAKLDVV
jgi:hypothetical protein